ncbi:Oidioi.mRNA.OKI2018_I69.PAR.g12768.t1.cds [Oikopleura dioica]|uniref:Oidioi.mRNA.OKI2018_I69.PAR.g12768.t1.cds n=1 Tax=Oikopleura dioica TaxID=34765 RepID=A0ABN7S4V8_OIKDI|nr:Oidioi.mRNA.OKI2018_I69.PAR.g12768.t1.cds [Oikopleura dioica]
MSTSLEASKVFLLSLPQELTQIREKLQEQERELKQIVENLSLNTSLNNSSPNLSKNEISLIKEKSENCRVVDIGAPKLRPMKKPEDIKISPKKKINSQSTQKPKMYETSTKSHPAPPPPSSVMRENSVKKYSIKKRNDGGVYVETKYLHNNGSSGSNENSPRNFRPPNRVPSSKLSQGQVQKEDITERKCPVCSYYFPNLSVQEFQEHVETHFEDDPTDFFELTHVE